MLAFKPGSDGHAVFLVGFFGTTFWGGGLPLEGQTPPNVVFLNDPVARIVKRMTFEEFVLRRLTREADEQEEHVEPLWGAAVRCCSPTPLTLNDYTPLIRTALGRPGIQDGAKRVASARPKFERTGAELLFIGALASASFGASRT
jgi:hypothetical protein